MLDCDTKVWVALACGLIIGYMYFYFSFQYNHMNYDDSMK